MIKVGLCGKIASGKSAVEKIFQQKGVFVVDLDIISHNLLENDNDTQEKIFKEFNTLDRKELAKVVFSNQEKKKLLENIIHPKLKEHIFQLFEEKKNEKMIIISGALLFQSGFNKFFDKTIFINADKKIRLNRLVKRNNFSEKEALKRIESQEDNLEKDADFIIENNGSIEELKKEVENLLINLSN